MKKESEFWAGDATEEALKIVAGYALKVIKRELREGQKIKYYKVKVEVIQI